MYIYVFQQSNPEGIDFVLRLQHEKKFTREEFDNICEEAIVYALEQEYKERKHAFCSSLNVNFLCEFFYSKGFESENRAELYYDFDSFEYEIEKRIKNPKLLAWLGRDSFESDTCPEYFKDEKIN